MSTSLRPLRTGGRAARQLQVTELADDDRRELAELADADPLVNAVVGSRLQAIATIEARTFGGTMLGVRGPSGRLRAAAFNGGNLLPVGGDVDEWRALAAAVRARRRVCSSIVGRSDAVRTMWAMLEPQWGPARAVRACQPLLHLERGDPLPAVDARVRLVRHTDIEAYVPASVAMFSAELGVSPLAAASTGDYRRRVAALIAEGRAFGVFDDAGDVVFKADIGAVSAHTCQVQGVWVRPDQRRRGIGTSALATVLRHALTLAPTASLYVNDFNGVALRVYERLGMRATAELATILF